MEDNDDNTERWTCEACGCITNSCQENPASCSVCGSARQIPDVLRREEPLSSQLLRRSLFARRAGGGLDFQRSFHPRNLDQIENDMMEEEEDEHAVAALALEVAGVADAARIPGLRSRRELLLRSAADSIQFGVDPVASQPLAPDELLEMATENASMYDPQWESPAKLGMRRKNNAIVVGDDEFANVATLPVGAAEGKSVRTLEPMLRATEAPDGKEQCKVFGYRVTFKRPYREKGKSLGGGYLVGVTTASFSSFDERNSLQESSLFWGIDDNGHKYEGGAGGGPIRGARRSHHGVEMSARNVARNSDNVLYGCLETITVVVDTESRTLTFWREDNVLGTLVRNIPRSMSLYPVVVPFNSGAIVAITGLDGSPAACLHRYEAYIEQKTMSEEKVQRLALREQRSRLVVEGKATDLLAKTLRQIFSLYGNGDSDEQLGVIAASRLWYRAGLKLKHLTEIVESKATETGCLFSKALVAFEDFCGVLYSVLEEDERFFSELCERYGEGESSGSGREHVQVGDIVELIEGYEKFGDAARGPMVPGDRGQVVEVQQGSNGERHSIRVLFNGRRWWYQPQTLLAEKSGLIATPAVWFVQRILRTHGYDHLSLAPNWGKPVTSASWLVGDIVVPAADFMPDDDSDDNEINASPLKIVDTPVVGRIVPPSSQTGSQNAAHDRDSGIVCVEFVDHRFGPHVGLPDVGGEDRNSSRVHRVNVKDLLHGGISQVLDGAEESSDEASQDDSRSDNDSAPSLPRDMKLLSELNVQAIESVSKECEKSQGALARVFASGLPSAVSKAVHRGMRIVHEGEDESNLLPAIASLGSLLVTTAKHIFEPETTSPPTETNDENQDASDGGETNDPNPDLRADLRIPHMVPPSRFGDSFGLFRGSNDSQVDNLGLRSQIAARRALTRRLRDRAELPPFGRVAQAGTSQSSDWGRLARDDGQQRIQSGGAPRSSEELKLRSPLLHSIRKGGFEPLLPGEDARRGAPVLNAATKSAIVNGILANNYTWFNKVVETAKRRKGSSTTTSALVNARDEDSMPLLVLAISLGCSQSIVSYLMRNGATVDDTVIRKAAYLGQTNLLSHLLTEHVYMDGIVDHTACSSEVIKTIESATKRQKEQEAALYREGEEFLATVVSDLIQFGIECRCRLGPKTHIYRSVVQILVGRILLRALHLNRLSVLPSGGSGGMSAKPKSAGDSESGRVNVFENDEAISDETERTPSLIAASEGLLFVIPSDILASRILKTGGDPAESSLAAYLRLLESLLWTKNVDDVALGLTLTSILLRAAPLEGYAIDLQRAGIADLVALHEREAEKRLESSCEQLSRSKFDPRRFSTHHVAAREQEVGKLVSNGVVLCPKCHLAELHLTRHSSFRCDLCGKGVDRGYPMHGCRECDWDACEDCINNNEGAIVKWTHVRNLSRECLQLLTEFEQHINSESVKAELSAKGWSLQILSARIQAHDSDALKEIASLLLSGSVTMFEFSNLILPVLHASWYGVGSHQSPPPTLHSPTLGPPRKKHRPQFRSAVGNVVDRQAFLASAIDAFILKPVSESLKAAAEDQDSDRAQGGKKAAATDTNPPNGDENQGATKQVEGAAQQCSRHAPELLRRLHEVLSFFEDFPSSKGILVGSKEASNELQSLTKPWTIEVAEATGAVPSFTVHAEPLTHLGDLEDQILRAMACRDSSYLAYCESLGEDKCIIAERPKGSARPSAKAEAFQIAQVVSFDSESGAHTIKYASKLVGSSESGAHRVLDPEATNFAESVALDGAEESVLLCCRQYVVLRRFQNARRNEYKSIVQNVLKSQDILDTPVASFPEEALPRGTRVEKSDQDGKPKEYTIIGCSSTGAERGAGQRGCMYDLATDDGHIVRQVPQQQVKVGLDPNVSSSNERLLRETVGMASYNPSRMMALRGLTGDEDTDQIPAPRVAVLKRTWSALSPLNQLAPVDLNASERLGDGSSTDSKITCRVGGIEIDTRLSGSCVEQPPQGRVAFSLEGCHPEISFSSNSRTLASAIRLLSEKTETDDSAFHPANKKIRVNFTFDFDCRRSSEADERGKVGDRASLVDNSGVGSNSSPVNTAMFSLGPIPHIRPDMDEVMKDPELSRSSTHESQKLALMCMQLIDSLGRYVHETGLSVASAEQPMLLNIIDASLESQALTSKLSEQLEQTLAVVSGAVPSWCIELPSLAPRLFSYASRRQLLERSAFGVSRATMRLQEAKVNVGPLRQRMAALRGRAVELVGEAFSGGAEDPTALQLQADELYGMEEALGARVNAAFRSQRWQERALQGAKAAVRRDKLLSDAATIMERYSSGNMIRQRRLEVRFDGESGFDAASGDEAGVTRGFYADVAEALLSCQHVTVSTCDPICSPQPSDVSLDADQGRSHVDSQLPLWIPDVDSSRKVVIPTPRASGQSTPGVFPRPLSPADSRLAAVKDQFRFMGRMFAGAMRDGFMFPLPLSCSFLRLVQCCVPSRPQLSNPAVVAAISGEKASPRKQTACPTSPVDADNSDEYSYEENTPTTGSKASGGFQSSAAKSFAMTSGQNLGSLDLPRPGFLGGEVYAIEIHICKLLDNIDSMKLREDETEKRYMQVAANRDFARDAFGKEYDLSFEDYVEDRTFVDPLDPTQGPTATPLCPDGHTREVTIFNVREWVRLAKQFVLHDGVMEQALSFRQGVGDLFPTDNLRLFTAPELQRDVCGGSDRVEEWTEEEIRKLFKLDGAKGATEALVAVAAMGGEGGATLSRRFGASSPTIGYLIKTLLMSTTTQRRQFLNFVTSVPIVTPGKIEVVPIVSPSGDFMPVRDNCLPRANTCARRLYLPKFDNYEKFSGVLWSVIREESKFKGFYEWRGN